MIKKICASRSDTKRGWYFIGVVVRQKENDSAKLENLLGSSSCEYGSELKRIAATFLRTISADASHKQLAVVTPAKKAVETFGQRTSIYRGVTRSVSFILNEFSKFIDLDILHLFFFIVS